MSSQDNANPDSPTGSNSKEAMFEPKPKPKMIRVLTVLAYVLSVSMAAILLSIYYIFMWDGRPHIGARRSHDVEMMEPYNNTDRYVGPMYSRHISPQGYSYNLSQPELPNNVTQDVPSADDARMVNGTRDNYEEEEFNTTTNQDTMTDRSESPNEKKLQQQITAIESEEATISSTVPTTSEEISVTWQDDYDEFEKPGIFFKKMIGRYDY